MPNRANDYWDDVIIDAFSEADIVATKEQIEQVSKSVRISHECYGMTHGHDCIPNPFELKNKKLKQQLEIESNKRFCTECRGSGRLIEQGPYHSSNRPCWYCNGVGKVT